MSENIAWAAGFFEGEGCFCYGRKPNGSIQCEVVLTNTDWDMLCRFQDILGFGNICSIIDRRSHVKPCYRWKATGESFYKLFELFSPWLSDRRKNRFWEINQLRLDFEQSSKNSKKIAIPL